MNEQELKDLIRQTIIEVLSRASAPKQNALVLFTGALLGFEDAIASLKRLASAGLQMDYALTPSAQRILDQGVIESVGMTNAKDSLVNSHDLLIVPTLTVNMVAKVTHGIGDCLASNVIAEFIMSNKPVIAAVNAACPDSADKLSWFPNMPEGYKAMLRQNLATFRSFGVQLAGTTNLDKAVLKAIGRPALAAMQCGAPVLSEGIVRTFPKGARVRIGAKALVTALGAEAAAANDITFERG